jgi:hypothetical protein
LQPARPVSATPAPGIVDTLSGGFDQINRILWIILLPIAVDLFLWFAPRLSAAPFVHGAVGWVNGLYASMQGGLDPASMQQAQQALGTIDQAAGTFNAWTILVGGLAVVPSIAPASLNGTLPFKITTVGQFLAVFVGLELVGALLGCAYLGLIAQQVRDGRTDPARLVRRLPSFVGAAFALIVMGLGLFLLVSIPVGLVLGIVRLVSPALGSLLTVLLFVVAQAVVVLGLIYLFFVLDAIVVSEAGPVRAVANSARVVAANFWGAVGFIVVFIVIDWGLGLVWLAMSKNPVGTFVAIVGNAYVASGLAAASMLYYRTRLKI